MLKKAKNIFFLGIGGIGMSALAKWAHVQGFSVRGWDDNPDTHLIQNITQDAT